MGEQEKKGSRSFPFFPYCLGRFMVIFSSGSFCYNYLGLVGGGVKRENSLSQREVAVRVSFLSPVYTNTS